MFTGFATENPTNVRVWDFCRSSAGLPLPVITLTDDCEEYQIVLTGGVPVNNDVGMRLYLPAARIEGKKITIVNSKLNNGNNQRVDIFSSDVGATTLSSSGTTSPIFSLGPGASISLIYSKYLNFRATAGEFTTGWISLDSSSPNANSRYTAVVGGNGISATNRTSTAVGGSYNWVTGSEATVVGGTSSTASGSFSAVIGGSYNTVSGQNAGVFAGSYGSADAPYATVVGGYKGNAKGITGNTVFAANYAAGGGLTAPQSAKLVLGVRTTDATLTTLISNFSAPSGGNQVFVNSTGAAYYFRGSVVATDGTNAKGWSIEGVIKRTGAGTSMVGTPTVTSSYGDAGTASWAVSVVADTTFNCISVRVTGAAATTIAWVGEINTTEGVL